MPPRAALYEHFPRIILLLFITVVVGCGSHNDNPRPLVLSDGSAANAVAVAVIDGDTIEVDIDGDHVIVRLIGIDTPEKTGGLRPTECYGDEATTRTSQLITGGQPLRLELDVEARDQYDRVLAYVHTGEAFVNELLVAEGFAAAMKFEPNTFHADRFAAAEQRARTFELGLWSRCGNADVVIE